MFRIEMLPAAHGDGLLVVYGDPAAPHHVLIDGGPYYAFRNKKFEERQTLSKRMRRLLDQGGSLELMVVTHIDADHIESPVRLLGSRPPELEIDDVWFNAWKHLRPQMDDELGPLQGEMLSALIRQQDLPWNAALGGRAVALADEGPLPEVTLPGGLRLTLLSPTVSGLKALSREWEDELAKAGLDPDDPEAALERLKKSRLRPDDYLGEPSLDVEDLAEEPFEGDAGLPNGSSIAFLAEYEGKRCLFGADAHAPVLRSAIQRLLARSGASRLHLDAFKIPHHGSKNNLSAALLEVIDCPLYLISTNGRIFGHPDRAAVARIIARGGSPQLCFNYRCDENAVWEDAGLQEQYGYSTRYGDEALGGLVVDL